MYKHLKYLIDCHVRLYFPSPRGGYPFPKHPTGHPGPGTPPRGYRVLMDVAALRHFGGAVHVQMPAEADEDLARRFPAMGGDTVRWRHAVDGYGWPTDGYGWPTCDVSLW